ncbi:hypothetical protein PC123_g22853 [Phytophthora cactorum]|nr:hypothetical protein PC120_g22418 [Phytophthora cactorum]KAG4041635.1 hypothetical protein PC123_g22853 [Phytophthora cactorum]
MAVTSSWQCQAGTKTMAAYQLPSGCLRIDWDSV